MVLLGKHEGFSGCRGINNLWANHVQTLDVVVLPDTCRFKRWRTSKLEEMQRQKKIVVMAAISLGIVTIAFLVPAVIIPTYSGVAQASDCAVSPNCAKDTFSRCGAYQSNGEPSFGDSLSRGLKGMICMLGLDDRPKFSYAITNKITLHHITLNKALLYIE